MKETSEEWRFWLWWPRSWWFYFEIISRPFEAESHFFNLNILFSNKLKKLVKSEKAKIKSDSFKNRDFGFISNREWFHEISASLKAMSKSSKIEKINAETRERATETAATFLQFTYPEDGIEKSFSQIFNQIQQFFNANFNVKFWSRRLLPPDERASERIFQSLRQKRSKSTRKSRASIVEKNGSKRTGFNRRDGEFSITQSQSINGRLVGCTRFFSSWCFRRVGDGVVRRPSGRKKTGCRRRIVIKEDNVRAGEGRASPGLDFRLRRAP